MLPENGCCYWATAELVERYNIAAWLPCLALQPVLALIRIFIQKQPGWTNKLFTIMLASMTSRLSMSGYWADPIAFYQQNRFGKRLKYKVSPIIAKSLGVKDRWESQKMSVVILTESLRCIPVCFADWPEYTLPRISSCYHSVWWSTWCYKAEKCGTNCIEIFTNHRWCKDISYY